MRLASRLSDLVPVILNGAVPETTGQGLVGTCRATRYPQRLHFVDGVAVRVANQGRRRARTNNAGLRQRKRRDVGPVRELRLFREVRRSRLVISRMVAKRVWNR